MKTIDKTTAWFCVAGLFFLVEVVFFFFCNTPRSIPEETTVLSPTKDVFPTSSPARGKVSVQLEASGHREVDELPTLEVSDLPKLPPVDYPPGSVGAACEINEFPPRAGYWFLNSKTRHRITEKDPLAALKNEECSTALEHHLYAINPYLWGTKDEKQLNANLVFSFVVIDNPLTFERIFSDPSGDFMRVQEAFANPDCQLGQDDESNWSLNDTCHAEAIFNYALLTRFCYDDGYNNGIRNRSRQMYWERENATPEQDRGMWIQDLEADWLKKKCKAVYPQNDQQAALRKQIWSLQEGNQRLDEILINLAAKLGDSAAGLTQSFSPSRGTTYREEGYKFGPYTELFTNFFYPNDLLTKHPPSVKRLGRLMPLFAEKPTQEGQSIDFNHEALVQYLCTPPYYYFTLRGHVLTPPPKPPSCRTIVTELRREFHDNQSVLGYIATFEDVAMRLEVYE